MEPSRTNRHRLARHRPLIGMLMFAAACGLGLPVLYSAAFAALPWVVLPEPPQPGDPA